MNLDPIILAELQRGGPPLWVSGRTYPKGWEVRSPANLQRYVRKVAGAGATDPSADTGNWELWSKTVDATLETLANSVASVKAVADALATTLGNVKTSVDASAAPLWRSGETVQQWDYRKSPLDGEIYQRKSATGAGATDPADDVTNYNSVSWNRPSAIVNRFSSGGVLAQANGSNVFPSPLVIFAPAVTANARTLITSVSGKGVIEFFVAGVNGGWISGGTTSFHVELIVDGRTIFNAQAAASSNGVWNLMGVVGGLLDDPTGQYFAYRAMPGCIEFARSFQIYVTVGKSFNASTGIVNSLSYRGRT